MSNIYNDFYKFLAMFNIRDVEEVEISSNKTWHGPKWIHKDSDLTVTTSKLKKEKGIQLTISVYQLERLIGILKGKGYYHDDDYTIKVQEEDLIMENPQLKQLHDQYKTMLYLLCGEDYDNG